MTTSPSKIVKGHHEKENEIINKWNRCNFATVRADSMKRHLKTHSIEKKHTNATNATIHLLKHAI